MSEEIIQPNTPVRFASRNMRPRFKRLRAGDIFIVEHEVEESVWNALRTAPENALWENVAWWHDGDGPTEPQPEQNGKPKPSKGEWGQYWRGMYRAGFQNYPDLIETLDCTGPQIKLRLRDIFEVDSLTKVSPDEFEKWLEGVGLTSLITLSRQAQAALEEMK